MYRFKPGIFNEEVDLILNKIRIGISSAYSCVIILYLNNPMFALT